MAEDLRRRIGAQGEGLGLWIGDRLLGTSRRAGAGGELRGWTTSRAVRAGVGPTIAADRLRSGLLAGATPLDELQAGGPRVELPVTAVSGENGER